MRDDFSQSTKDTLFKRAGGKCSNPECGRSTSAPHTDDTKAINIGVAAHITAASVGGPRYDATLSQEERISATNGIWLCQYCGTLIDSNAERYPVALLKHWKQEAESLALSEVENRNWARQMRGSPLESSTSVRCDFYTHISPPLIHHVKRAEIGEAVRAFFLSNEFLSEATTPGKSRPIALQGIGGIGKTIIARALCEDPVIQATFSDGILGVVLGKMPELASKLREWIYALGGTVSDPTPTTDFLKNILAQLLQDKACLLIIDDVWQRSHAEAFLVGGPRCRVVLTTRDAELARELGAKVQPIPPMTEGEAIHLLEEWADGHLAESTPTLKKRIVKRLGYLPLAMKLAGARLRRKPPQQWFQSFNISKLKSPRLERVHDDLERTFELSLEELHEQALHLYISLAIFKEDEAISQRGIERLWQGLAGLDAEATEDLLKDLADRALIELTPHGPTQIVGLHDLLRDVIKAKLGEKNKATHQSLLSAYRSPKKKHAWYTISDDGYLYDHLAYHLFEAGEGEELKALFVDQQWLHVRVSQRPSTYDGYLADLSFAVESASAQTREQSEMDQDPESFAECFRYVLIRTSINNIAGNYMPELITRAVETGAWTSDQAIGVVEKIPYPEQQINAYLLLLETHLLSPIQWEAAQDEAAKQIFVLWDEEKKARFLARLVPLHSAELVEQAITALEVMTNSMAYIQLAIALHPQISDEKQTEILQKALSLNLSLLEEIGGKDLYLALVPLLPEDLLVVALDALFKKPSFFFRPEMLTVLATRLRGNLLEQALERTLALRDPWECEECLRVFVPLLPESLLRQGLEAALARKNEWMSAHIIAPLAPKLRNGLLHQALEHTLTFSNEKAREWALAALLGRHQFAKEQLDILHPMVLDLARKKCWWPSIFFVRQGELEHRSQMLQEILKAVLTETVQWERVELLNGLFPVLNEKQLEQVLEILFKKEESDMIRPSFLQKLTPYLNDDLFQKALNHVFQENNETFVFMLSALKPYLSEEQIEQVLRVTSQLEEKETRLQLLKELAPCLNGESHQQVFLHMLELIFSVDKGDSYALTRELISLAPYLKGPTLKKAWDLVRDIKDDWTRKQIVAALIPQMAGELLEQVFRASLDMREEKTHLQTLIILVPRLEGEQSQRVLTYVLETTLAITDSQERIPLLIQLIPHLEGNQRDQAIRNALEGALTLPRELARAQSLALLVPFLIEQERDKALAEAWKNAQELGNEHVQMTILELLAPHLSDSYLEQAQSFALGLQDKQTRHQLQIALAQRLSFEERNKILTSLLAESLEDPDERVRLRLLSLLAPQLNNRQRFAALSKIRDLVQLINDDQARIEGLVQVMSLFTAEQQQWALSIIVATTNEWLLTAALIQAASQLHAPVHEYAVQSVLSIKDEWFRAQALAAFFPLLSDQRSFLRLLREAEVNGLLSLQNSSRENILQHHLRNNMFISPLFSSQTLGAITSHIIEICRDWNWQ